MFIKKIILFIWVFFAIISVNFAQSSQIASERVNSLFQNYIKENIYQKISAPLYDDELVSEEDYLKIALEVKREMESMLQEESSGLKQNEIEAIEGLINEVYVQLAELYLERMVEQTADEKLNFLSKYYADFFHDLKNMQENLAKIIIKTYQDAFNSPYYLSPGQELVDYFKTQDARSQEIFDAAFILHGIGFLIEDIGNYEERFEYFKKNHSQSRFLVSIEDAIASVQKLKKGIVVEDFSFVNQAGEAVRLSSLKSKIVYLDLWASWCGPCIQTFKTKTPAFEEKLKDYPEIELMYVSIDEKKDSWEKYLEKNPMMGTHVYSGLGFEAPIVKYFKVFGIPRYVIIGKENRLLDANAPRPGDEAFEKLIRYLDTN
jgi:thiol-disulfide isomerase/thioredoxin